MGGETIERDQKIADELGIAIEERVSYSLAAD